MNQSLNRFKKLPKNIKMLKLFMNNGPWGPWNENPKNNNPEKKNQNGNKPNKPDFDLDQIIDDIGNFFKNLFSPQNKSGSKNNAPKSLIGMIILGFIAFWLLLGVYKVDSDENAVVLYFGKFYKVATPGLNYHIPYPFGQVVKRSVINVNSEEFGFSSGGKSGYGRNFDAESLMLTGDENIVDIEFEVQWQISDIYDFVFNIADPDQAIRKSSESAMREIIARTPIASALSDGKEKIEDDVKVLLQETLDSYKSGVRIVLVQLRRVDPPSQVIDFFRDVQTAKADKEKEINEAQSYANDIIPRARGLASQMKEQAEAYAKEVVTNAEGEAGRFMSVYNQYVKAKQVTKKRIYLETMEKIYSENDKIFIDKSAAKSAVMPYFPLNDLSQSIKKSN
jgi:modulator of FtsH protease HflK